MDRYYTETVPACESSGQVSCNASGFVKDLWYPYDEMFHNLFLKATESALQNTR